MATQVHRPAESKISTLHKKGVARNFNTALKFVGGTIISRLHPNNQRPFIRLVRNSKYPSSTKRSNILKNNKNQTGYTECANSIITKIDWTRGRCAGEIVKIEVRNGLITQKSFLTPKGTFITIHRKELGLRLLLESMKLKPFNSN